MRRYVESHDHAIRLKAEIMVDHFHEQVLAAGKIGGQARAMVVCSGIERAIQYFHAIKAYLVERKSPYQAIVAFSGEHEYSGAKVSEASLNGFPSRDIAENIQNDPPTNSRPAMTSVPLPDLRLQIERGPADDLEHIGSGGLLLEGLAQFVEQARVLDSDDRLRGEILDQLNLLVGERPHLLAIHSNRANKFALLEHWDGHMGPRTCQLDQRNNATVLPDVRWIGPQIVNMDNLFGLGDTIERDFGVVTQVNYRITSPKFDVPFFAVDRDSAEDRSLT